MIEERDGFNLSQVKKTNAESEYKDSKRDNNVSPHRRAADGLDTGSRALFRP